MIKNTTKLKHDFEAACNAYLKAFCEKHGYDYEDAVQNWVGGDVGGFTEVSDLFVGMDDIRTDINIDAPEEEFMKHYDYCLRVGSIANGELNTPNYDSWLRGCPRMSDEKITLLEKLQQDIRDAEQMLETEIKNSKQP